MLACAALDFAQQLGAVQRYGRPYRVGLREGNQRHDDVAVGFVQLLPGVLQHAILARHHLGLPVELAPPACNRGNKAGAV